jgi:transcriptional regulator with XRE-family HTH domain
MQKTLSCAYIINKICMVHLGQNIARLRGMRRWTQKEMCAKLNIAQPEYSRLEKKELIDDELIERIAIALEVSPEIIKEFREEAIFTNNIYEQNNTISQVYFQTNSLETIIELYNKLLKEKDEVIEMYKKQAGD